MDSNKSDIQTSLLRAPDTRDDVLSTAISVAAVVCVSASGVDVGDSDKQKKQGI